MAVPVTYGSHYPWNRAGGPATNRPHAEVVLTGPNGSVRVWCLVDSGADRMVVDSSFAAAAGIGLGGATPVNVLTATGARAVLSQVTVTLDVEGVRLVDDVRFGAGMLPLLGRVTFLNAFAAVGFDAAGWLAG